MGKFFVYKITNIINQKFYIGFTSKTIEERFEKHLKTAKIKNPNDYSSIHKAINKYGSENFKIESLQECFSEQEAKDTEIKFIAELKARKLGYNETDGGDGVVGYVYTDEQRKRMSENKKVIFLGEGNPFYGKHHSDETKAVLSKLASERYQGEDNPFYGKVHSEETLNYLSEINTGSKHPQAKLTEEQVLEIRRLFPTTKGTYGAQTKLAKQYGIGPGYLRNIIRRYTWKHI